MKNCYVYVLLDPRKPIKYQYGDTCIRYEPYYVGKGVRYRMKQHFGPYERKHIYNPFKRRVIDKIEEAGLDPSKYCIKIHTDLSNEESSELEIKAIQDFRELFRLTNIQAGGESGPGHSPNKGKTYEQIYGKDKAELLKKDRREKCAHLKNKEFIEEHVGKRRGKTLEEIHGKEKAEKIKEKQSSGRANPVCQIEIKTGKVIKTFASARKASVELGLNKESIESCLSNPTVNKSHGGFGWVFENRKDGFSVAFKKKTKNVCRIDKVSLDVLEIYESVAVASQKTGMSRHLIYLCLSKHENAKQYKSGGGYFWKYENDKDWEPKQ